jgi:hypothetical protein
MATRANIPSALKPKDLIGIPWRVAFALQADGWYLRSDIIWAKGVSFCPTYSGSCMPESVRDRPTKGHEYVFLLSKNKRYFYDGDAVREDAQTAGQIGGLTSYQATAMNRPPSGNQVPGKGETYVRLPGRNLRSVWTINPGSYAGAHFATFPPALVEPMTWRRVTERGELVKTGASGNKKIDENRGIDPGDKSAWNRKDGMGATMIAGYSYECTTTGWTPTCTCDAGEPVPCTVLDPFTGSGTTIEVAIRLRRRGIGIELSQAYCDEHIIPRLEAPIQMELV